VRGVGAGRVRVLDQPVGDPPQLRHPQHPRLGGQGGVDHLHTAHVPLFTRAGIQDRDEGVADGPGQSAVHADRDVDVSAADLPRSVGGADRG
jgi:hypothetical protein